MKFFSKPKEIPQTPTPCSQQSIIDIELEDLALSPKSVQLVESSDGRVSPLNLSSEMRPTTSESKIPHRIVDGVRYDDLEIFCLGKEKPSIKKLSRVECYSLIDIGILEKGLAELAVCKICKTGNLEFYQICFMNGVAKHYFIVCDRCRHASEFYTLPKSQSSEGDNKIMFGHNVVQILSGRLSGIDKSGLNIINAIMGLPLYSF